MELKPGRISSIAHNFAALLDGERKAFVQSLDTLLKGITNLRSDTPDRRLVRLADEVKKLKDRFDLLIEMSHQDFLAKIKDEAEKLEHAEQSGRAGTVLTSLVNTPNPPLNDFCERMLDGLIAVTGAKRGFVLFYLPESSEADVIAARHFQTLNLSVEEYDFSRTLLREVLRRGETLLIEDASSDEDFSSEVSIRRFQIRSVLAAPLIQANRTIGALYLENNVEPGAFEEADKQVLEEVVRFAIFYLNHARLLPPILDRDRRVFFDEAQATKQLVGKHPKILQLLELVGRLADSPATVLIDGESGTGKELIARALHFQSARRDHPFVAINCAAIPESLLESELFGHEKGAFTGATERRLGRIEWANKGTLFLDEVSELAYPLQAKLLRFLQSNEIERLGGKETISVDVRVVAATSKDLKALTEMGKFQEALYYRLNVVPLRLPALRERRDDIPLLVDHFLNSFCASYGRKNLVAEPEVYAQLKECSFPGNVRELENLVHRLVALATDDCIRIGDLPDDVLPVHSRRVDLKKDPLHRILQDPPLDLAELRSRRGQLKRILADQERELALQAVQEAGGNLTIAAERLGVHRVTLHKILRNARRD